MTFRIIDDAGAQARRGQGPGGAASCELKVKTRDVIRAAADGLAREGLKTWSVGTLAQTFEQKRRAADHEGVPRAGRRRRQRGGAALRHGRGPGRAMAAGTRRMLLLNVNSPIKYINGRLSNPAKLALSHNPYGNAAGSARGLRRSRRGPPDRPQRRPGVGRGGVPEAVRRGPRRPGGHLHAGGAERRARPVRLARGGAQAEDHHQPLPADRAGRYPRRSSTG